MRNNDATSRMRNYFDWFETPSVIAQRPKIQWPGHRTRTWGSLAHTVLHGTVEGKRIRGQPKAIRLDKISQWTRLQLKKAMGKATDRE